MPNNNNKTIVGFNPQHELHFNTVNRDHPEHPNRIFEILKNLEKVEILKECHVLREFPSIKESLLQKVHSKEHLDGLKRLKSMEQEEINDYSNEFDSVNLTKNSYEAALEAAACAVHLTQLLVENKFENGFALIRPPGHHAQHSCLNGFCLLNNVALAARRAEELGVKRILIIDFDVHHGQGTQYQFYDSKNVLYFSTHRYEQGAFWPHLRESDYDFIGSNEGMGFNVNVPINESNVENIDFMHIFWRLLYPIAVEFQPELILYSAGFDSCAGDPVGQFNLTPSLYACWIHHLKAVCPKQLLILEGGYNHRVQALCVQHCLDVLLGGRPEIESFGGFVVRESTVETCNNSIHVLQPYWSSLGQTKNNGQNSLVKSRYLRPSEPPKNTGDIHQHQLKVPFDVERFGKRLEKPKIRIIFDDKMEIEKAKNFLLIIEQKWQVELVVNNETNEILNNNQNSIILLSTALNSWQSLKQSNKNSIFIEQTTNSFKCVLMNEGETQEEWSNLSVASLMLKLYSLLTQKPMINHCVLKVDRNTMMFQLAWHLQTIQGFSIVLHLNNDFDSIEKETHSKPNFFNCHSS